MFWKAFGELSQDRAHDAVIDRWHGSDDSKCKDDGSGKGSDGSGKGSKGSDGSGKGSKGSDGSGKGSKGSDGSGKGSEGSYGSGKGSEGSYGSGKGSKGSDGSGSGSDCGDYVCGGNGDDCFSIAENTTFVADFDSPFRGATGDDGVTYHIIGGADAGLFTIDDETGELSFINAPDFEDPGDEGGDNTYDVTIRAINIDNPCKYKDTDVCVTVTDVEPEEPNPGPNAAPQITNDPGAPVETSQVPAEVFDVDAFDEDGDTLQFSIIGGADQDTFTIDQDTGVISRVGEVSRFGSADGDEVYSVEVQVSDGNGGTDAVPLDFAFIFAA